MILSLTVHQFAVLAATFLFSVVCVGLLQLWNGKTRRMRSPPTLSVFSIFWAVVFERVDNLAEYFTKKSLEIGPIFMIRFGFRRVLVLNNIEVIDEALQKQSKSYAGREPFYTEKNIFNKNGKGVAFRQYDADYQRYHSLYMSVLKEFGYGQSNLMETRILTEVEAAVAHIKLKNGAPFDPDDFTIHISANVIGSFLFGRRRDYDESLTDCVRLALLMVAKTDPLLDVVPVSRFLPSRRQNLREMITIFRSWFATIEEEAEKSMQPGAPPSLVSRVLELEGPNYDREQLTTALREFVAGGADTAAKTMLWAYVYLANNQEVQKRLQKEIDEVVPRDRFPLISDKPNLPYVEATLTEILRLSAILPLSVPRLTMKDTKVCGYFVPAGTVVIPNIYAAHRSPREWEEPETFKPERFLDADNKYLPRRIIPFSVGRRSCLGEVLARYELFLILAGLIQNFTVLPPEGQDSVKVIQRLRLLAEPSPFEIRMMPRT